MPLPGGATDKFGNRYEGLRKILMVGGETSSMMSWSKGANSTWTSSG
jgi:hypothetical protein